MELGFEDNIFSGKTLENLVHVSNESVLILFIKYLILFYQK